MTFEKKRDEPKYIAHPFKKEFDLIKYLTKAGLNFNASVVLISLLNRDRTQYELIRIFDHLKSDNTNNKKIRSLFIWDEISENNSKRLINFLKQNYCIDWVKTAKIEKSVDSIRITTEKNVLSLRLKNRERYVNVEIDGDRKDDDLIAIREKGKLKIYTKNMLNRPTKGNKNPIMKNQHKVAKGLSELREIHLFEWDDDKKIKDFLIHKYDLGWVNDGIIERTDNFTIIKVSNEKNHVTLSLKNDYRFSHPDLNSWKWKRHEYVTKVLLIIDDGRTDEFDAKMIGSPPAKLKIFKNRGWLDEREVGTFPDDAKYKVYSLKVPFENIISDIENQNMEAFDRFNKNVLRLKKLYNIQH